VAAEVLELTADPQIDARRLKECIERDPALAAKVLRVVNSSLFGLSRNVRDLNQALAMLGTKPLKLLVLGFSLPDSLFRDLGRNFLARYWQRTLIKAVAAREVCESAWRMAGDEAFLAGLLQELGMLVLAQDLGAPYVQFVERAWVEGADVAEGERAALGFDHGDVTERLLARWQLPETLVAAARLARSAEPFEHLPPTKRTLPQVLWMAELLARLLADGQMKALPMLLAAGNALGDLPPRALAAMVHRMQSKVEQLAEVLSLDLPCDADYSQLLAAAHERLAGVAAEAAGELATSETAVWVEARHLAEVARQATRPAPSSSHEPVSAAVTTGPQPSEPGLEGHLQAAAAQARAARRPLSLVLIEIDRYPELVALYGRKPCGDWLWRIKTIVAGLDQADAALHDAGEAALAVILPGCDRSAAATWANLLLREVHGVGPRPGPGRALSLSIGAAAVCVPPRNFQAATLVDAAQRCLFAARALGGNAAKSIEVLWNGPAR
jgi:HD-like signal output (HDOD) protein/GGDEF domain-containing protein